MWLFCNLAENDLFNTFATFYTHPEYTSHIHFSGYRVYRDLGITFGLSTTLRDNASCESWLAFRRVGVNTFFRCIQMVDRSEAVAVQEFHYALVLTKLQVRSGRTAFILGEREGDQRVAQRFLFNLGVPSCGNH